MRTFQSSLSAFHPIATVTHRRGGGLEVPCGYNARTRASRTQRFFPAYKKTRARGGVTSGVDDAIQGRGTCNWSSMNRYRASVAIA